MPCVYKTTNLLNLKNGIMPYRYIGSDQYDRTNYLGSSKKLKEDISIYGNINFKKEILFSFTDISNVKLREIEKKVLTENNCAKDESYYNKTNSSHKGYILNEDEKEKRKIQLKKAWENWNKGNTTDSEYSIRRIERLKSLSKEVNDINYYIEKYGEEIGREKFINFKEKISENKKGEKNGMCKYSNEVKELSIKLFFVDKKSRSKICEETGISYGVLKLIIRNYKNNGNISVKNSEKLN